MSMVWFEPRDGVSSLTKFFKFFHGSRSSLSLEASLRVWMARVPGPKGTMAPDES